MRTTKLGLSPVKTLTGIPAARNKPQRERIDAFGRVKPIGSYSFRPKHECPFCGREMVEHPHESGSHFTCDNGRCDANAPDCEG
jgi:hypothetical protein